MRHFVTLSALSSGPHFKLNNVFRSYSAWCDVVVLMLLVLSLCCATLRPAHANTTSEGDFSPSGEAKTFIALNTAPRDIALSNSTISENAIAITEMGSFETNDPDTGDTFTYALVAGDGDQDNGSFAIVGDTLKAMASFDYETNNSPSIRVRSTDAGGLSVEKIFLITVNDINDPPIAITLSSSSVAEKRAVGTTVGTFSAADDDAGETLTYSLVAGEGDTNNGSFQVNGTTLKTKAVFDYMIKSSYSIRVQVKDAAGETFKKIFVITVTNINDAPVITTVTLPAARTSQFYNQTLSASDPDGDTLAWNVTSGALPSGLILSSSGGLSGVVTQAGTFTFTFAVRDGNGGSNSKSFTIVSTTNTAPVVSVTAPNDGDVIQRSAFLTTLRGSVTDDAGVSSASILLFRKRGGANQFWNGAAWTTAQTFVPLQLGSAGATTTSWSWTQQTPGASDLDSGLYGFLVKATDTEEVVGIQVRRDFSLVLALNNTAPVISVTAPNDGDVVQRSAFLTTLRGIVSDDAGVSGASILLFRKRNGANQFWNGVAWTTTQTFVPLQLTSIGATTSSWKWTQRTPGASDLDSGLYGFYVKATDTENVTGAQVRRDFSLVFALNNTAPVISVTAPNNGDIIERSAFLTTLRGSVSDDAGVSGASILLLRKRNGVNQFWNGTAWVATQTFVPLQLGSAGATTTTWKWTQQTPGASDLDSGLYSFYVMATDTENVTGAQVRRDFTLKPSASGARAITSSESSARSS